MSQFFASIFRRRPNEGWFRVGNYDATTVDILCALNVAAMVLYGINSGWWNRLVFTPDAARSGEVWNIITWPAAGYPDVRVFISIVFFWSFGQQVEGMMGRNRFAIWTGLVTVVPALVLTATGGVFPALNFLYSRPETAAIGLSTLFLGAIWVYAATYPNVRFFDVIPLWAIAAVFTALDFLRLSGDRLGGMILFLIVANATALSAARSLGYATAWPIPHIPIGPSGPGSGSSGRSRRTKKPKRQKRGGSGPRVVEGPWRKDGGSSMPAPPTGPPMASPADQAELDGLLDKIGDHGMESLSGAEKQRLNELSKRLRNR